MNDNDLFQLLKLNLKRDEGFRSKPYKDTMDKWSIGYGRNLDDVGISQQEAEFLLDNDTHAAINEVNRVIPDITKKPWQVRLGIYNMAFNMGITKLLGFKKMLAAIDHDDFEEAATQALDSKWAQQVGARAQRIARLFIEASTS